MKGMAPPHVKPVDGYEPVKRLRARFKCPVDIDLKQNTNQKLESNLFTFRKVEVLVKRLEY